MTTDRPNILVPVDFSSATDAVLDQAVVLARAMQAKVWVIHVSVPLPNVVAEDFAAIHDRDVVAEGHRADHRAVQDCQAKLRAAGVEATALLVRGTPTDKIIDEARRLRPALLVMGSHGHGALYHLLAGSVCDGVLRHGQWPVVVVPAPARRGSPAPSTPSTCAESDSGRASR
jgi:nucleotide-binding universal stress UspA family protein